MTDEETRITINGRPLKEFIKREVGKEGVKIREEIILELNRGIQRAVAPSKKTGGRTAGNPGVKKGKVVFCKHCIVVDGRHDENCKTKKESI